MKVKLVLCNDIDEVTELKDLIRSVGEIRELRIVDFEDRTPKTFASLVCEVAGDQLPGNVVNALDEMRDFDDQITYYET